MNLDDYKELEVLIDKEKSIDFTEFLEQNSKILGYYEVLFDKENDKTSLFFDKTKFKIYLSPDDKKTEILLWVYLKVLDESIDIDKKNIKTSDYQEAYKEFYKEFSVGIFEIIPSWNKKTFQADSDKISLFINPGLAFGTGHHETTQLMLERISSLDLQGKSVLDIGTGSGILSIACAKMQAKSVLALDIDENCIAATRHNALENSIDSQQLMVEIASFDADFSQQSFDFLLININFAIIEQNIDFIKKIPTKQILFSGIIEEKKEDFCDLLKENLMGEVIYQSHKNGWLLFDFLKS